MSPQDVASDVGRSTILVVSGLEDSQAWRRTLVVATDFVQTLSMTLVYNGSEDGEFSIIMIAKTS